MRSWPGMGPMHSCSGLCPDPSRVDGQLRRPDRPPPRPWLRSRCSVPLTQALAYGGCVKALLPEVRDVLGGWLGVCRAASRRAWPPDTVPSRRRPLLVAVRLMRMSAEAFPCFSCLTIGAPGVDGRWPGLFPGPPFPWARRCRSGRPAPSIARPAPLLPSPTSRLPLSGTPPAQVEHGVCEREFQVLKLCVRGALRKCLAASRR